MPWVRNESASDDAGIDDQAMTIERQGPQARIEWLDYARLVCALSVLVSHYLYGGLEMAYYESAPDFGAIEPWPIYGFLGVDCFFIISGFVISMSVAGRTASDFAAARFVRLYPAFLACMTLTALVFLAAGRGGAFAVDWTKWSANLIIAPRWFGEADMDPVYWTLETEIKFYLLVFIVMLAGQARRLEPIMAIWLGLMVITRLADLNLPMMGWYFPMFVLGAAIYFGTERGWTWPRMAVLLVALAMSLDVEIAPAMVPGAAVPEMKWIVGTVILLFTGLFLWLMRARPRLPHAARIGGITYPLYLLHQMIGYIAIDALHPSIGAWPAFAVVTLAMILLAMAVNEFVERRLKGFWRAVALRLFAPVAAIERRMQAAASERKGVRPAT